jgi:quinol monooxygenase YgiN
VIALVATYRGKEGSGDTIEPLLAQLAAASRREPGNLLYFVNRSLSARDTFVMYEQYVDDAAVDAHRASAHFQDLGVGQVIPMLEERIVDRFQVIEPG